MVNVTNHARIRYCERILGMTDRQEIKQYLAQNNEKVTTDLNKMHEYSQHIYRGQIGDNVTRAYRMADNIVLVMNSQGDAIVTLFKCVFDFGEDMDRKIIKHELESIKELNDYLDEVDIEIEEFIEGRQAKSTNIDLQLKALEEQIKLLRQQKSFIDDEVKNKRSEREFASKEVQKRAIRICNSIEYRSDLNEKAI